ncbi:stigma-specific STIG1-like protein 3 [Telopea speciosissima]|uniref:stigma-specific STIG1-like protein 3 n=1 Tax=Telopea speciosissima TaxID=54955 RepID=UPI001CC7279B|nr:stigma-specific STIG1-like protein 3 [Telopea speciosissima]
MALAISLTIITTNGKEEEEEEKPKPLVKSTSTTGDENKFSPVKRVSRFLAEQKNPRASSSSSDHCQKDNDICYEDGNQESTCCNNKCVDLKSDSNNCGACKKKCNYTHTCCNGECVDLSFDKGHCGRCFNKCMTGGYCIYGMCDYA